MYQTELNWISQPKWNERKLRTSQQIMVMQTTTVLIRPTDIFWNKKENSLYKNQDDQGEIRPAHNCNFVETCYHWITVHLAGVWHKKRNNSRDWLHPRVITFFGNRVVKKFTCHESVHNTVFCFKRLDENVKDLFEMYIHQRSREPRLRP
jgi:hypothetical protein